MAKRKEPMSAADARRLADMRLMSRVARESGMDVARRMFPHIAAELDSWPRGRGGE